MGFLIKRGEKVSKTKDRICCLKCKKDKAEANYYITDNILFSSEMFEVCKACIKEIIDEQEINGVKLILRTMNKPFDKEEYVNSKHFGDYMRKINSLPQYQGLTWDDSSFRDENRVLKLNVTKTNEFIDNNATQLKDTPHLNFKLTEEIILRWGNSHELEDYMELEDFYKKMKDMNRIETPQEEAYLKKLAVISLKMDQELEKGNYGQVKQLGDLFSKYMADSKFRAMDKSDADKTGGIRNFSTIYAEVEKDDHIPPWEKYRKIKGLTQDIVDKTIMHIENFTLKLNRIEKMIEPPEDTPMIEDGEV